MTNVPLLLFAHTLNLNVAPLSDQSTFKVYLRVEKVEEVYVSMLLSQSFALFKMERFD